MGKLNCQHCRARLGGFNFINHNKCPCGRDATVHLIKSRVDQDHKDYVLIVQPRRTRPEKAQVAVPTVHPQSGDERPEFNSTSPDTLQFNCATVRSHNIPAGASSSLTSQSTFPFSPLYCISHKRKCSLEDDTTFKPSCFCPAGLKDESAFDLTRAGADGPAQTPVTFPTRQQFDTAGDTSIKAATCHPSVAGGRQLAQEMLRNVEDAELSAEAIAAHENVLDSDPLCRRTISDNAAEQQEDAVVCYSCFYCSTTYHLPVVTFVSAGILIFFVCYFASFKPPTLQTD